MLRHAVLLSIWLMLSGSIRAQTSGDSLVPNGVSAATNRGPVTVNADEADVLIRTETGKLVPLSDLVDPEVAAELLRRSLQQQRIPDYIIASLDMTGAIEGEAAELTVTMQVRVRSESEWVSVPLALGETFLRDFAHTSAVEGADAVLTAEKQNTRTWHLQGRGMHTLKMTLAARVRTTAPGTMQLALTLPRATASHAELVFSAPVEFQRLPPDGFDRVERDERGIRKVEFWGLNESVSVAWNEVLPPVDASAVIQVQNRMRLDLTTIPASLNGVQTLKISGAPITEITVDYPAGFALEEVDARNAADISVMSSFEIISQTEASRALIRLSAPVEGTLNLPFELEVAEGRFPGDVSIRIPSIESANIQTGDLDIQFPSGLLVQQTQVIGAQRRRVAADTDPAVAATAFRMRSPESLITLHVEEIESQYAVDTEMVIIPEGQAVILKARFRVNVVRGSLLELPLLWSEESSSRWTVLPGSQLFRADRNPLPVTVSRGEDQESQLTLAFAERQSGEFVVEFQAFVATEAFAGGSMRFSAPQVMRQGGQPVLFRLADSDQYRITLTESASGNSLVAVPVARSAMPEIDRDLPPGGWLPSDPETAIDIGLEQQEPVVQVKTQVELRPDEAGVRIYQRFEYAIDFRDLSEVALFVPSDIRPVVRIAGTNEPLRPMIGGPPGKRVFRLPESVRGQIFIEADWLWPLDQTRESEPKLQTQIPLILPADCTVGEIRAGTSSWSGLRVAKSDYWRPVYSELFDAAWQFESAGDRAFGDLTGARGGILLPVDRRHGYVRGGETGPAMLLLSTEFPAGFHRTTQTAVYEQTPESITIEIPQLLDVESIRWGGTILTQVEAGSRILSTSVDAVSGNTVWSIFTGAAELQSEPAVLQIACRQAVSSSGRLYRREVLLRPLFPSPVPAPPLIWSIAAGSEFSAVLPDNDFDPVSGGGLNLLPGAEPAEDRVRRYLDAVLAPFPAALQEQAGSVVAPWLVSGAAPDLFFSPGSAINPRLLLIPRVSMLLVASSICVAVFMILSMLPRIPLLVPVLLTPAACLAIWVLNPAWAEPTVPWVLLGLFPGLVAVWLNRQLGRRRMRLRLLRSSREVPSVFGFSEYEQPVASRRRASVSAEADFSAEVSR